MIKKVLKKLSAYLQSPTESFKRHDSQYVEEGKLEKERQIGQKNIHNGVLHGPEMRINELLERNPKVKIAIDIGSGTGWSAAALSPLLEKVIGIEPSKAAVAMAIELYPEKEYPNITWINDLSEKALSSLKLDNPALFFTGCVLNHIRDKEVIKICQEINNIAPIGSVISFAENWGEDWHQIMWHIRTKDWWNAQLPDWELDFHGPEVEDKDKGNYHKGIHGVKIK